jgi:polyhydroxybutyrate depolymerase
MPEAPDFIAGFSEAAQTAVPVTIVAGTADRIIRYDGGRFAWWARRLFKVEGTSMSAEATVAYFAARNGIGSAPVHRTLTALAPGGRTRTRRTDYREAGRPPVSLVTIVGADTPSRLPRPARRCWAQPVGI